MAGLLLCLATSGCEAVTPQHDMSMVWVDVKGRAGHSLSAMRVDGQKVDNAGYVQIPSGKHRLEVRLGYERTGSAMGSQWRYCQIIFDYDGFSAGQRYSVYAVATGFTVRAWLRNQEGERIQESRSIRCGSQY